MRWKELRLRHSVVKVFLLSILLSLSVLASLPQFIPTAQAQATITYTVATDLISWTDEVGSPDKIWLADTGATGSSGKELKASSTYTTNGSMSLTRQPTPADDYEVKLNVVVTAITGSVIFTFNGKDEYDNAISDALTMSAVQTYTTTKRFKSVDTLGVVRSGFQSGESIKCKITQDRWGKVWKIRSGLDLQYQFDANLKIGDGTRFSGWILRDTNVVMASSKKITVKNNAYLKLGDITNEALKSVDFGSTLQVNAYPYELYGEVGSSVSIYGSKIIGGDMSLRLFGTQNRIWHSQLDGAQVSGNNLDLFDVMFVSSTTAFDTLTDPISGTFDKVTVVGASQIFIREYYLTTDVTVSNIYSRGHTYVLADGTFAQDKLANITIINGDFDTWNFYWTASSKGRVWRKYTFDLTVTYPNGTALSNANVTLTYSGQGSGTVGSWLTDSNGEITTQTLTMGFYNQTGGNTIYSYNPYNLTVFYGNYSYTKLFNLTEKTSWEIALTPTPATETVNTTKYMLIGSFLSIPIMLAIALNIKKRRNHQNP